MDLTIAELLSRAVTCEEYLKSEKEIISKDGIDEINTIVGGTRLLCQDKMGRQFRHLCLKAKGEMPLKANEMAKPTNQDLQGFWELIMLQVEETKNKINIIHQNKNNKWKVNVSLLSNFFVNICLTFFLLFSQKRRLITPKRGSKRQNPQRQKSKFTTMTSPANSRF